MIKAELPSICLILSTKEVPEIAERALKKGIRWIQLREKERSRRETLYAAFKLKELTGKYNAILTINDYLDIAIVVKADGLHIGQNDLPIEEAKRFFSGIIGISTHNFEEALEAERKAAHYIGFGPIFKTTTKIDALEPRGLSVLSFIQKKISIPVVAIGGINKQNIAEIIRCGCKNVALSSGILTGNMEENIENLLNTLNKLK